MAVADKGARVHCACKVGFVVNSTEQNRTTDTPCTGFSALCFGSCRTEIIQPSNLAAMIGTDVQFQCQYNILDGNYEFVLTYINHTSQGIMESEHYQLSVNRESSSSTLTIKYVQPRDKAICYYAVRHHDTYYHTEQKL
ncbi:unnamed protein product [Nyctereutes procyonoides]|uniref:(raccoon dog) hypothetical protein n=1 Tax=Nyctereutes procyonoides TaxID=34880 RepID=A0A811ZRA0_NYCPR|nr:unnamed protein product [Nyctereutes procyonoides]